MVVLDQHQVMQEGIIYNDRYTSKRYNLYNVMRLTRRDSVMKITSLGDSGALVFSPFQAGAQVLQVYGVVFGMIHDEDADTGRSWMVANRLADVLNFIGKYPDHLAALAIQNVIHDVDLA